MGGARQNDARVELSRRRAGIRELPLNAGTTRPRALATRRRRLPAPRNGLGRSHGTGISINGQDPRSNVYLLDGTPQNDFTNGPAGSAAGTVLGVETIREFRVETNAYSAEFGRNSGGQINAISKSGTNTFHGSLYEFHRNDRFDARNFFDPAAKPEFRRNQFGASFGGPSSRTSSFSSRATRRSGRTSGARSAPSSQTSTRGRGF